MRGLAASPQKSGVPLDAREHALAAAVSGGLLGISLLGARFPRFLALPLAAVGASLAGPGGGAPSRRRSPVARLSAGQTIAS